MRRASPLLLLLASCIFVEPDVEEAPPCSGCVPLCGDGVVDADEACDDGAENGDDAPCTRECQLACGDGVVQAHEGCDEGPANGTDAASCKADCTPFCGDGVVAEAHGERCDAGAANDDRHGRCTTTCLPAVCGDRAPHGTEACDGSEGCLPTCALDACAAAQVAAGPDQTLVLRGDGVVLGAGHGLGLPGLDPGVHPTPQALALPPLVRLAQGSHFGVGITPDGALVSWGENRQGQRGVGTLDEVPGWSEVDPGPFRDVAAGKSFALAIRDDGRLVAFGSNEHAALGVGADAGESCPGENGERCQGAEQCASGVCQEDGNCEVPSRCVPSPVDVAPELRFLQVAAGEYHAVGITTAGEAVGWGLDRGHQAGGQAGANEACGPCVERPGAIPLEPGLRVRALSAGGRFTALVDERGALWTFGGNRWAQLGARPLEDGETRPPREVAYPLGAPASVSLLAAGDVAHVLFWDDAGSELWSFGRNDAGQLGRAPSSGGYDTELPGAVDPWPGGRVIGLDAGASHSIVLDEDGRVFVFGARNDGAAGDPAVDRIPREVPTCP